MPDAKIDGAVIHYEQAGEGPPLLLLHGIGSNSRSWRRQLDALSSDFTVVAWDAPGYGRSSDPPARTHPSMGFYAGRLHDFLNTLGFEQIFLLGHSTGGVMAQEFYRAYPDSIKALILADTRYAGSQASLQERLAAVRAMSPAQFAEQRAPKLLTSASPASLVREVISIMSEIHPAGYEFAAIALSEADTRDVISNLQAPTLFIWGAEDAVTPVWDQTPPGAQLEIIPNAGHLCYIEQPDRFNAIVRDFLKRISGYDREDPTWHPTNLKKL